jgi:hypothetical protein
MSRPYVGQQPKPIFLNQDMTGTLHSAPLFIGQMSYVGFDLQWTGSPTGTFTVEVSNSYSQGPDVVAPANAGNWTPLTLSQSISASGSAGGGFIDIDGVAASWIRLTYTPSGGTGSLTAYESGKVI